MEPTHAELVKSMLESKQKTETMTTDTILSLIIMIVVVTTIVLV